MCCPDCGSLTCHAVPKRDTWQCRCRKQFTIRTGTIFAYSSLPFGSWLCAIWLIANARGEIHAPDIQRALAFSEKTGLSLLRRVRSVLADGNAAQAAVSSIANDTVYGGSVIDSPPAMRTIWLDDPQENSVLMQSAADRFINLARHVIASKQSANISDAVACNRIIIPRARLGIGLADQ